MHSGGGGSGGGGSGVGGAHCTATLRQPLPYRVSIEVTAAAAKRESPPPVFSGYCAQ